MSGPWLADYLPTAKHLLAPNGLPQAQASWRALGQAWTAHQPDAHFQAGWCRVRWQPERLIYEMVFAGRHFQNRARSLNELTWQLGDVAEVFVETVDQPRYLELHVTPENERLQLIFPFGGIAEVRAGRQPLEAFFEPDPNLVDSTSALIPGGWYSRVIIPSERIGGTKFRFSSGSQLRTAVCRYDTARAGQPPVLSTTAPLTGPTFHDRERWSTLTLVSADKTSSERV